MGVAVSDPVTSPLSHHSSVFFCLATILHPSVLPSLQGRLCVFSRTGHCHPNYGILYNYDFAWNQSKPFLVLLQPAKRTPSTACTATCSPCPSLWDLSPIPPTTRPQVGSPPRPSSGAGKDGVCCAAVPFCRAVRPSTARTFGHLPTKWPHVAPKRSQGLASRGSSRVDSLQDKINKCWKNQLKTELSKDPRKWLAYF